MELTSPNGASAATSAANSSRWPGPSGFRVQYVYPSRVVAGLGAEPACEFRRLGPTSPFCRSKVRVQTKSGPDSRYAWMRNGGQVMVNPTPDSAAWPGLEGRAKFDPEFHGPDSSTPVLEL